MQFKVIIVVTVRSVEGEEEEEEGGLKMCWVNNLSSKLKVTFKQIIICSDFCLIFVVYCLSRLSQFHHL